LKSKTEKSSQQTASQPKPLDGRALLDVLFETRRYCYYVGVESYVEGKGFRPSIVFENEAGHYLNGGGDVEPWYWGPTYKDAEAACEHQNLMLGITAKDAFAIVCSSMNASRKELV
jgi:hypothetical protein